MPKISPLYNLVDSFSKEQLRAYGLEKRETASRSYFMIRIPKENIKPVLPDHDLLQDAHFSIDQDYNMDEFGYTPIHITLNYKDTIVHGYLNIRGEYQYSQSTPPLSAAEETNLKNNIQEVMPMLHNLFEEQKKRQTALQNTANRLDLELSNLSHTLDHKKTRENYIQKAREFIEVIQELNLYSGTIDRRYISMARLIDRIEAIYECQAKKPKKSALEKSKETKDEPEYSQPMPDEPAISPAEKLKNLHQEAMGVFSKSINEFNKPGQDPDQLKANLRAVNENLFVLYSFDDKMFTKEHRRKISTALEHLKKFYDTQSDTFNHFALNGDLTSFRTHFFHYAECIKPDFYKSLINHLVKSKWDQKQSNILDICNFLNQNDENYKAFIIEFSRKEGYPIPHEQAHLLFGIETISNINKTHVSLLLKLYIEDKIELFKAFLDQGADYNWSIQSIPKDLFCNYYTLFYSIAISNKANYLDYLKLLIAAGIDPNLSCRQEVMPALSRLAVQESFPKHVKAGTIPISGYSPPHPLCILSHKSGVEGLNLLLTKAPLNILALHWIELLETAILDYSMTATSQYNLYYACSMEDAIAYLERLPYGAKDSQIFTSYIPFPRANSSPEDLNAIKNIIYTKMKLIDIEIDRRLSQTREDDFDKQYQNLFALGIRASSVALDFNIQNFDFLHFLGCEILLFRYVTKRYTQFSDQYFFLKKYVNKLYLAIVTSLSGKPSLAERMPFYTKALQFFTSESFTKMALPKPPAEDVEEEGDVKETVIREKLPRKKR